MILNQQCIKLDSEEHTFVGISGYAKAWKYYNGILRHVQTSYHTTFDKSNTKLFPILNQNKDETLTILLEGENCCE